MTLKNIQTDSVKGWDQTRTDLDSLIPQSGQVWSGGSMGVNLYGPQDFKVVSMVTEQKVDATVKVDGQKYKIWMNERDKTGRSWGMRRPKRPVYYRPGPSTVAQRTVQSGPRPFTFQRDLLRDRPLQGPSTFTPLNHSLWTRLLRSPVLILKSCIFHFWWKPISWAWRCL